MEVQRDLTNQEYEDQLPQQLTMPATYLQIEPRVDHLQSLKM